MKEHAQGKVLVDQDGPVTTVTINRPAAKNACDVETVQTLHDVFMAFEADDDARVAILTGADGAFCAGADLAELATGASIGFYWAGKDRGLTRRRLAKPVIAAVEGHAVAAGLALAVWCDLRVASATAVFGVFCRRFGGPMPNGCTVRLPRIIGESRALDMLMTGRAVGADEAMAMGLADRLAPAGGALAAARELAGQLANFPQLAMLSDRASPIDQWNYPE
ncbi:MAG: crotonase/enoyl-CoA hydratase family protein, partial [Rhodospirillaceae bacterium]|nr:crotonase/enoyl-CoA hydratase family protein [Rhodospirillaceae bacterium]